MTELCVEFINLIMRKDTCLDKTSRSSTFPAHKRVKLGAYNAYNTFISFYNKKIIHK